MTENLKDKETELNQLKKDYDQPGFQMFKIIEKEDLLKTNEGDASKAKAQADETYQTLTVQEKEQFNLMVPIMNKSVCFCNENNEKSMVTCDSCYCWYHNKCLGLGHGFTNTTLLFLCPKCQQNTFGLLLQFLRLNFQMFIQIDTVDNSRLVEFFLNLTNNQKIILRWLA